MKKVVYNEEQIIELVKIINALNITGIDNCKLIVMCTNIIDTPIESIEVEDIQDKEGE